MFNNECAILCFRDILIFVTIFGKYVILKNIMQLLFDKNSLKISMMSLPLIYKMKTIAEKSKYLLIKE